MSELKLIKNFISPGARLKFIREEILQLPPRVLKVKYALSPYQVYSWENGRLKITDKVLEIYKKVFAAEGILVTNEWVLEGSGPIPTKSLPANVLHKIIDYRETEFIAGTVSEEVLIHKELQAFLKYHDHAICVQVESDAMLPFYFKGDYVCGELLSTPSDISKLVGFDCIIKLEDESILVRRLSQLNEDGSYNLACHSPLPGVSDPTIFNAKVSSAARILLHRIITSNNR